jgi:hypothetical protein
MILIGQRILDQQMEILSWLVSTLAVVLRKVELVNVKCASHKTSKGDH